jgi:hypothetical protein
MRNTAKLLLLDVLSLRVKYSDDDFEKVVEILNSKDSDPFMINILELSKQIEGLNVKQVKSRNRISGSSLMDDKLSSIKNRDPEKHRLLMEIADVLRSNLFPNTNTLKQYISLHLSVPAGKRTKADLISLYLLHIFDASPYELEKEIKSLKDKEAETTSEVDSFVSMANKISESKK